MKQYRLIKDYIDPAGAIVKKGTIFNFIQEGNNIGYMPKNGGYMFSINFIENTEWFEELPTN